MNKLSILLSLVISLSAKADLICSFEGNVAGITHLRLFQQDAQWVRTETTTDFSSDEAVDGMVKGSLKTLPLVLSESEFLSGMGVTRISFEKSESGFRLVEAVQCDYANGEERGCLTSPDRFVETRESKATHCQLIR